MRKFRNLICFLSHVCLGYITLVSSDDTRSGSDTTTVSPLNAISCDASGIIHATGDTKVQSVLVECNHNEHDTLKAAEVSGDDVTIAGCPINKPVKIFIFDTAHDGTEVLVVKSSGLLKEIIVVCNGLNITVESYFTNSPFSPVAVTRIPLTNQLKMILTDNNDNALSTGVDIDNKYKLKITAPGGLFILVESCDAAADPEFKVHPVQLYVNRQPKKEYDILTPFSNDTASSTTSDMAGFRLLDSPVVYLRCFVDVCKEAGCTTLTKTTPTSTAATGSGDRRRRRNVDIPNRKVTLSTSFRVKSSFTTSRANGNTAGDQRYVVLTSLLMMKLIFFDRH